MFGKRTTRLTNNGRVSKSQAQISRLQLKQKVQRAKRKTYQEQAATNRARQRRNLESRNPFRRGLAQMKEASMKKQEVRMRKLEAQAQAAEQNPTLQAEAARAENRIKIERARLKSKTASSTALAAGMASLGRGLSDENNQDDAADRASRERIIKTIFQPDDTGPDSGNTGLTEGVE